MESNDDQPTPTEPAMIPEGASAVRFIVAQSDGDFYLSYRTLEHALADRDATMIFEADFGGQILLSCPVHTVHANQTALRQLLVDMEMITWGPGYDPAEHTLGDAEMYFEHLPVGSGVIGGMGGGVVTDGIWLHAEVEELGLRPQIEAVISADIPRLNLPTKFPHIEFSSLAETKPYPLARAHLFSTLDERLLVDCLARIIHVDEARLLRLIMQLDAVLENEHPCFKDIREHAKPRLTFLPAMLDYNKGGGTYVSASVIVRKDYRGQPFELLERNRTAIEAILAGNEAPIC